MTKYIDYWLQGDCDSWIEICESHWKSMLSDIGENPTSNCTTPHDIQNSLQEWIDESKQMSSTDEIKDISM